MLRRADARQNVHARRNSRISARGSDAEQNPLLRTLHPTDRVNIGTIPKKMPTNFQLKRLKLKLDIVEKPENRVHKLTDSNVSRAACSWQTAARLIRSNCSSIKWLSLLVTKCPVFDDVISRRHDVIYNCHVTPRAQIRYRPSIGLIFKSRDFKGDVIQPYLGIWHQKIFIDFIFKNKTVKQGKWYLKYLRYYWPW